MTPRNFSRGVVAVLFTVEVAFFKADHISEFLLH